MREDQGKANTSPLTLSPLEARLIGDQLRGIVGIAAGLSRTIREKDVPVPFNADEVKAIVNAARRLIDSLEPLGEDGGRGG
jgi:hypothetical protein